MASLRGILSRIARIPVSLRYFSTTRAAVMFEYLPPEKIKPYKPVQVAGRRYLPGKSSPILPNFLNEPKENFPLVVGAAALSNEAPENIGKTLRTFLDKHLPEYHSILFKNLPMGDVNEVSKVVSALGYEYIEYVGGAADRDNVIENLNTASNDPPEFTVETHNEMAYSSFIPPKIIFCCLKGPRYGGGEGVIADNILIEKNLDPDVLRKFTEKGIKYMSYLPNREASETGESYMPWQQRLLTECGKEAETRIKSRGYDYHWHEDGGLTYWLKLPAFRTHPVSGRSVWCNQAIPHHKSFFIDSPMNEELNLPEDKFPYNTQYGDGTEIEPDVIEHVRKVTWECSVGFAWEAGDMLVLDNFMMQHGRMSFDEDRQLVVALTKS